MSNPMPDPLSHVDTKPQTEEKPVLTETLPLPKEEEKLVEVPTKRNPIFE